MAIVTAVCDSYLAEILDGVHQPGDDYKQALYTASATLNRSTTVYSATNEVPDSGTYVAGGQSLAGRTVGLSGTTTYVDFSDMTWTGTTITSGGALIYNATRGNKAVATLKFTPTTVSTNAPFIVEFPAPGPDAVIHITNP